MRDSECKVTWQGYVNEISNILELWVEDYHGRKHRIEINPHKKAGQKRFEEIGNAAGLGKYGYFYSPSWLVGMTCPL